MFNYFESRKIYGKGSECFILAWQFCLKCVLPRQIFKLEMHAEICIGPHVKCPLSLLILAKIGIYLKILVKTLSVTFHKNPFSGSRVVIWRNTKYDEANRSLFPTFRSECKANIHQET
jgi:hypothetical protein